VDASLDTRAITASVGTHRTGESAGAGERTYHLVVDYVEMRRSNCTDGAAELVWRVYPTGERELVYAGCPRASTPAQARPPSAGQVRDAVGIPNPVIATSPRTETLSGLRTDFWYDGPTERSVTVTLNGFTVTATARATSFQWSFGDGASTTTSTGGSADNPAAHHAYRDRGDKTVTLVVTWTGSYTFTGPGGATGGGDLGAQPFTTERVLGVHEVQPVGQP
jgi:hypothetical protein